MLHTASSTTWPTVAARLGGAMGTKSLSSTQSRSWALVRSAAPRSPSPVPSTTTSTSTPASSRLEVTAVSTSVATNQAFVVSLLRSEL